MISGMRPPSEASTWLARVGLIRPLALADGAASGLPTASSSACIAGWAGTRSAMVGRPAVTMLGDAAHPSRSGTTSVSGPGPMLPRPAPALRSSNAPIALGRGQVRHMDDQRVEARAALGGIDARDRFGVGGVGGEAVDGLGRHRDRLAGEHQPRGFGDRLVARTA